jgi:arginyl-tRNA synthetase
MNTHSVISEKILLAFTGAQSIGILPEGNMPDGFLERPQKVGHGDFATTLPLKLARFMKMAPMEIAKILESRIELYPELECVEVIEPGFINLFLNQKWLLSQVEVILKSGNRFGESSFGNDKRVQVEYVSVNPTGPIHVGHARGAVLGSALSSILRCAGYSVTEEYYINDAGNQMDLFYQCLYTRYMQALGYEKEIPESGYHGEYLVILGENISKQYGEEFSVLPEGEAIAAIGNIGLPLMIESIKADLHRLGVEFDSWFSEKSLFENGHYTKIMDILKDNDYIIQREGAIWFQSSRLGEEKDNVLVRSNGTPTYFASDAAYHYYKFNIANYERVTDIWGADHQGHVGRLKSVISALGIDDSKLNVILSQMVTLRQSGDLVRASKRSGQLVTLNELLDEVGVDSCRFFFLSRSPDAQMEFDLDLASKQSSDNPVYYIQYAHARIVSILKKASSDGITFEDGDVQKLTTPMEKQLIRNLLILPELIETIASLMEPHHLPHYSIELANSFHYFYDNCRVFSDDISLTKSRLKLLEASRIVILKTLVLMGMSAPEQM